ncbi:MAG: hypothetical protein ACFHXK_01965 [bacterium]
MTTRDDVRSVLAAWEKGEKDELTVWQWAEAAKSEAPADELVRDLVDVLATLPFDMILKDDIPVMIDALANPESETDLSINLLWNHLDALPADQRRHELSDHPFYGQFCDGMG